MPQNENSKKRKGANSHILTYTLPKLHTTKNWYVDFSCLDPAEGKMRRKKYMLDAIEKLSDRRHRAKELIAQLTHRLVNGWNPWAEVSSERMYTKFTQVTGQYIKYIEKLTGNGTMKKKTGYDYQSRLNMLSEYNNSRAIPILYH